MVKKEKEIKQDASEVVEEAPAVEEVIEDVAQEESTEKKDIGAPIRDALKQVETFGQALSEALQGRGNVVMVRINDEALKHLDMLIEAEITKSRSESAAYLINSGIVGNEELFGKISAITQQISDLREQLRQEVKLDTEVEAEEEK